MRFAHIQLKCATVASRETTRLAPSSVSLSRRALEAPVWFIGAIHPYHMKGICGHPLFECWSLCGRHRLGILIYRSSINRSCSFSQIHLAKLSIHSSSFPFKAPKASAKTQHLRIDRSLRRSSLNSGLNFATRSAISM